MSFASLFFFFDKLFLTQFSTRPALTACVIAYRYESCKLRRTGKKKNCGLRSVLAELLLPSAEMKYFLHAIGVSVVFMCMFIFESCNIVSFFFDF